jgi:chromosome segregation ATPase
MIIHILLDVLQQPPDLTPFTSWPALLLYAGSGIVYSLVFYILARSKTAQVFEADRQKRTQDRYKEDKRVQREIEGLKSNIRRVQLERDAARAEAERLQYQMQRLDDRLKTQAAVMDAQGERLEAEYQRAENYMRRDAAKGVRIELLKQDRTRMKAIISELKERHEQRISKLEDVIARKEARIQDLQERLKDAEKRSKSHVSSPIEPGGPGSGGAITNAIDRLSGDSTGN